MICLMITLDNFEPVVIECPKDDLECKNTRSVETAANNQEKDNTDSKDATDTFQREQSPLKSDKCTPTMTENNEAKTKSKDPHDSLAPASTNIEKKEGLDVNSNVLSSADG